MGCRRSRESEFSWARTVAGLRALLDCDDGPRLRTDCAFEGKCFCSDQTTTDGCCKILDGQVEAFVEPAAGRDDNAAVELLERGIGLCRAQDFDNAPLAEWPP